MTQADDLTLCAPKKDWLKDYDSIVERFNWIGFHDEIGHPLTMTVDFMAMAEICARYIALNKGNQAEIDYFNKLSKDNTCQVYLSGGDFLKP